MVQAVSEDKEFSTIEFNEFLVMMSKQQQTQDEIGMEEMMEAVRYDLFVLNKEHPSTLEFKFTDF